MFVSCAVGIGHLEDSSRVILIVRDRSVAHPSLHHRRVQPRVRHRRRAAFFADESADVGVATVLLLDGASPSHPHEEEDAAGQGAESEHADDGTGGDAGLAGGARPRRLGRGRRGHGGRFGGRGRHGLNVGADGDDGGRGRARARIRRRGARGRGIADLWLETAEKDGPFAITATHVIFVPQAGEIALVVVHLALGRREEIAAPTVGAVGHGQDGFVQLDTDRLAISRRLIFVIALVFQRLRRRKASHGGHLSEFERGVLLGPARRGHP